MPSTNQEQYLLELVNDARLDPLGDAARYLNSYVPLTAKQQNIQDDLNYYGVSGAALQQAYAALTPTQPLAWNDSLATSARQHDQAMISADTQSHQEPGEPDFVTREENAGYALNGAAAENVYAYAQDPLFSHAGFMVDWGNATPGHRDNIMDPSLREVGIGMVPNTNSDPSFGPNVLTEDFGSRGSSGSFILGVAYNDLDHDGFYSVGEGLAGLTVSVAGVSTSSTSSGGDALQTSATGNQSVTLSGAGLAGTVTVGLTLNNANLKLDVVNGNTLRTSASATVSGPISRIEGLGTIGLDLTGDAGAQTILGSLGADTLTGGGGKDTFAGTTAQLAGDTITDLAAGDIIVISDAVAAHFSYNVTGTTLDFDPNTAGSQAFDAITLPTAGNLTFSVAADPTSGVDLFVNAPPPPATTVNGVTVVDTGGGHLFVGTQNADGTGTVLVDLPHGTVSRGGQVDATLSNIQGVQLGADPSVVLGLTSGTDLLYGGSGPDSFYGGGGTDYIQGGTGTTNVVGGSGNEIFYSGGGADAMRGGTAANFMAGGTTAGDTDYFYGNGGQDYVYGRGGATVLVGAGGAEYLSGGTGFNELVGAQQADSHGNTGFNVLQGGSGTDLFYGGIGTNLFEEGSGTDAFKGSSGTDLIYGGSGQSFVYGGSGTDVITTGAGNQYVQAGTGQTYLNETAANLHAGRFDQVDNFKGAQADGTGTFLYLPNAVQGSTSFVSQNGGTAILTAVGGGTAEVFVSNTNVASVQAQTHFTL
jgi:Ca2+-binding RTX toxin-like protein